jgi:hypothetical protein
MWDTAAGTRGAEMFRNSGRMCESMTALALYFLEVAA